MTPTKEPLRECPFCGAQMLVREYSAFHPENNCWITDSGHLEIGRHEYAAWNRRASPPPSDDLTAAAIREGK